MVRQTRRALAVAALVAAVLAGCGGEPTGGPDSTAPVPPPAVSARWGEPVAVDGYTITLAAPVDVTDRYPCDPCTTATLTASATLTAGVDPVDPHSLAFEAHDGNYGMAVVSRKNAAVVPAGGSHTGDIFIDVPTEWRHGLIVVRLTGATGVVEWRQESR